MDQELQTLTELTIELKRALYNLVDEYNRCIHEAKEETSLHEKFPPLTAEELEEKIVKIAEDKCIYYMKRFYSVDEFFQKIINNEDISKPSDNEHLVFFSKLWLGDIYDTKGLKNIKALEHYIKSLIEEKGNIQEKSFDEIFYRHF